VKSGSGWRVEKVAVFKAVSEKNLPLFFRFGMGGESIGVTAALMWRYLRYKMVGLYLEFGKNFR